MNNPVQTPLPPKRILAVGQILAGEGRYLFISPDAALKAYGEMAKRREAREDYLDAQWSCLERLGDGS